MKIILLSRFYTSVMNYMNLAYFLIFFFSSLAIHVFTSNHYAFGQTDKTPGIDMSNKSTDVKVFSNDTGIMHNTTGIIDDAIDDLRDSFRSLFGK